MGTFLTTSRMNRALAARIEASVQNGTRRGSPVDRRWTVVFRLAVLVGMVFALVSLTLLKRREDAQLEQSRASLLDAVTKRRAELAATDLLTSERAIAVLLRASGPYQGDVIAPELRVQGALSVALSRPMLYLRAPLDAFRAEDALERAALLSQKDPFTQCLLDPPRDRSEKALLGRIRDGANAATTTAHVHRLYDLLAGLPLLQSPWKARVKTTQKPEELARLDEAFHLARMNETVAAARSRLVLFLADEPSTSAGPTELDGERAHSVRVTLFDLDQGRPLLRVRRSVDPGGFSDRGRASHATGLDGCALSFAVREAAEGVTALTETAAPAH